MAQHKTKINNCNGGFAWCNRPANKMNNNELRDLGQSGRKFAKRYSSKKTRKFLQNNLDY